MFRRKVSFASGLLLLLLVAAGPAWAELGFDFEAEISGYKQTPFKGLGQIDTDDKGRLYVVNNSAGSLNIFESFQSGNRPLMNRNSSDVPGASTDCDNDSNADPEVLESNRSVSVEPAPSMGVYVIDMEGKRLTRYSSFDQGKFTPEDQFCASDIASQVGARVSMSTVQAFDQDRAYVAGPAHEGGAGFIFVVDFGASAAVLDYLLDIWWPSDIDSDSSGSLAVASFNTNEVRFVKRSAQGQALAHELVPGPPLIGHPGDTTKKVLGYITAVAHDSLGRVYLAESFRDFGSRSFGGRIRVFSNREEGFREIAATERVYTESGFKGFQGVRDIEIDGTRLYVVNTSLEANESGSIYRMRFDDANADGIFDSTVKGPGGTGPGTSDTVAPSSKIDGIWSKCRKRAKGSRRKAPRLKNCTLKPRATVKVLARRASMVFGRAEDSMSEIERVEVTLRAKPKAAVSKKRGGKKHARKKACLWLARKKAVKRSCAKPVHLKARLKRTGPGRASWRLKLNAKQRKRLASGKWTVRTIAQDSAGNREGRVVRRANSLVLIVAGASRKRR